MKKLSIFITFIIFMLAGCTATKSNPEVLDPVEEVPVPQEVQTPAEEPEIIIPEPEPIVPEPEPELEPVVQELTPEEQEFLRSTKALNEECIISIDTFTKDKKDVLDTIAELDEIMKKGDYVRWLTYVSKESKDYWMNAKRLKELEGRLPVKGLKLSGLRDYFKYIFIPARAGHTVDEIRYVSDTVVKAVQVKENRDVVYYTFEKIEGKWLLKLDTL